MAIINPYTGRSFDVDDFVFLKGARASHPSYYCTIKQIVYRAVFAPASPGKTPNDQIHLETYPDKALIITAVNMIAHRLHPVNRLTRLIVTGTYE